MWTEAFGAEVGRVNNDGADSDIDAKFVSSDG